MRFRAAVVFVVFSCGMLSGYHDVRTEYYTSLKFLKSAEPPRAVAMVMQDRERGRSSAVKRGILFTYANREARDVMIGGDFSSWKPLPMERSRNGIWYFFLAEPSKEKGEIKYKFLSDGRWIPDPLNGNRRDDGAGSYLSLVDPFNSPEGKQVTYRFIGDNLVEFRIYKPDADFISVAGDFNNWNPEMHTMSKGDDGIWRIRLKLPAGVHRYNFIVDGRWKPDIYNGKSSVNAAGDLCSLIKVE